MRLYNSPNVGSVLVYGGLKSASGSYRNTVGWSQAFGVNGLPTSFEPTLYNVANQVEIPIKGPIIDGFSNNGNFYVASYWDMAVLTPRNYTSTLAPILAIRPLNVTRGVYTSTCVAQTDTTVYGLDSRDVWEFDGQSFRSIGDQAVKQYLANSIDPNYTNRIFMEHNSNKYQIEIYYPDKNSTGGVPNKMLSYRYDLKVWNAPRDVCNATFSCESPIIIQDSTGFKVLPATRTVLYISALDSATMYQGQGQVNIKDLGFLFPPVKNLPAPLAVGPINAYFAKSGVLLGGLNQENSVHRIYPRLANIGGNLNNRNQRVNPYATVTILLGGSDTPAGAHNLFASDKMNVSAKYVQPTKLNFTSHSIQVTGVSSTYDNAQLSAWFCNELTVFYTTNTQQE